MDVGKACVPALPRQRLLDDRRGRDVEIPGEAVDTEGRREARARQGFLRSGAARAAARRADAP
jgi:hypothetical protein